MWHNLAQLFRYRGLIQSLVARELKARYRGSVLGFFWSFVNPLLLLRSTRSSSRRSCRHQRRPEREPVRACSCSAACCRGRGFRRRCSRRPASLIAGGNLIKKVLFPAEVLPIVSVLANMVHFFLGLLILAGVHDLLPAPLRTRRSALVSGRRAGAADVHARAGAVLSALTVHFRDIRDLLANLLTFWFFATPIIYSYKMASVQSFSGLLQPQPVLPPGRLVPGDSVLPRARSGTGWLLALGVGVGRAVLWSATGVFDRLRDSFAEAV